MDPRAMEVSFFILLFAALAEVTGVHINELSVPAIIQNGTEEYVTLDCDYTIEDGERNGLVVKWFFGEHPVYQWIPNQKPQDLGILRGKLNLNYEASPDKYKMYRALQIRRPSVNLSGRYLCRVSTFFGEAYKAASMIVFAPEKDMGMKVAGTQLPGYVNVSCWASGVFPEPRLTLYHGENREQRVDDMVVETRWNKGAYDIRAYKILEDANLSPFSTVFDCELSIPSTDYVVRRSTLYEPGSLALKDGSMASGGQSPVDFSHHHRFLSPFFLAAGTMMFFRTWSYVITAPAHHRQTLSSAGCT